jgi:hypothetical protein
MADKKIGRTAEHSSCSTEAPASAPSAKAAAEIVRTRKAPLFITHSISGDARAKGRATG